MSKIPLRRLGVLLVLAGLVFSLAACAGEKAPVKFGVLMAFTGDLGSYGADIAKGCDLAAKQINAAGGILGAKVETVQRDTQTSPQAGTDAARKLVDIDKVPGIVGALSTGVTLAVAESVTIPGKVVQISPASTARDLTVLKDNDFVFRTTASDALQSVVLAGMARQLGFSKVSTLYVNNTYGQGLNAQFAQEFTAMGGTVLAQVPHEQIQPNYQAEVKKALEGGPEVIMALSYPESAQIYLKEIIATGYKGKFMFCDGTKSPELITAVGAQYLNGTYGTAAAAAPSESGDIFKQDYETEYGELPPKPYIGEAYDALVLLALAAQKAGKADGTAMRDSLRDVANPPGEVVGPGVDGLKRAIELIKQGKDINYEGAAGSQDWDENGDVRTPIEVWKVENGQIVRVQMVDVPIE